MKLSLPLIVGLLITVVLSFAGCGKVSQVGEVKGRVTLNGEPARIEGLWITFLGSDGQVFASPVDDQGLFPATEIPIGEFKVGFNIAGLADSESANNMTAPWEKIPNVSDTSNRKDFINQVRSHQQRKSSPYDQENLPFLTKYLDPLTSGLTTSIQPGKEIEFNPDLLAP